MQGKKVVPCRHDWHQTGGEVTISVYAKNSLPELSQVVANSTLVSTLGSSVLCVVPLKVCVSSLCQVAAAACRALHVAVRALGSPGPLQLRRVCLSSPARARTFIPALGGGFFQWCSLEHQGNHYTLFLLYCKMLILLELF